MIKYWLVVFLLIVTLFQDVYAADSISLNFDGTMKSASKTNMEGKKDVSHSLNQVYHLDLRKDITSKIYFTTYAGANAIEETEETEETEEADGRETTRLSPQFRLNIANDYFNANGGYLLNETGIDMFGIHPTEQSRLTTKTWTSNFSTKSVKYPNIRFRYDEQKDYDHLSVHLKDSLSKYYELLGDYTYKFVEFTLRHSKDKIYDYVKDTDDTTTVNEGRINFRESFWGSRITTSGTYTVTDTEKENVTSTDTTSTDETRKDLVFDAGLKLRPFKWCRISYNYELNDTGEKEDTDIDTDTGTDADEITSTDIDQTVQAHNISIRGDARLHKYLNSWAQYRKRREYNSKQDDTSTDTFTLNFNSTPIETLNANLIFNHLINKTESETQSETSSMLLHIIANIWEGVDLSVDGQINYTDNIVGDTKTLSKTINSDLRLKLTKTLTTEINYITEWTDTKNSDGTEISTSNYTIGTDIYYRPVQSFYFKFSCELQKNENAEDLTYYISDINWIMTEKLRANLQYKMDKNSRDDSRFSSDLVWNMSKIFVLRFNYDWSREKENNILTKNDIFTTTISAKF